MAQSIFHAKVLPYNIDLSGQRSGMLLVKSFSHKKGTYTYWNCVCDCGNERKVCTAEINRRGVLSCGCLQKKRIKETNTKHGSSSSSLYRLWATMKSRCENPNVNGYKNYGGRGVHVCERWKEFIGFQEDMQQSYEEHTSQYGQKNTLIERIDNDQGYSKSNCRWATRLEQASNTRNNRFIEYNGQTRTLAEWSRVLGIHRTTLSARLNKYGFSIEKAFSK